MKQGPLGGLYYVVEEKVTHVWFVFLANGPASERDKEAIVGCLHALMSSKAENNVTASVSLSRIMKLSDIQLQERLIGF